MARLWQVEVQGQWDIYSFYRDIKLNPIKQTQHTQASDTLCKSDSAHTYAEWQQGLDENIDTAKAIAKKLGQVTTIR